MFLFIFESIGTQELLLIGIVALIFLGPRKLPQIAKTIGKTLADFRNTTSEFKETWQREVNFEEEEKAIRTGDLPPDPIARVDSLEGDAIHAAPAPEIKEIDKESFDKILAETKEETIKETGKESSTEDAASDKRNWL